MLFEVYVRHEVQPCVNCGSQILALPLQELKAADISLAAISHSAEANPVDVIWGSRRPPFPQGNVRLHPLKIAGLTVEEKLAKVQLLFVVEVTFHPRDYNFFRQI